nr:MAG TPA: hypothetical protein [Bacteriophage sp.]DAW21877.1 MAG TPA: hypothetical protein [Bacteriophage sp.]DAW87497.1 MAG TPA: hypothetical protein [Bacteriophage sp.]
MIIVYQVLKRECVVIILSFRRQVKTQLEPCRWLL